MNKLKFLTCFIALLCFVNQAYTQPGLVGGNYDYHDTFGPMFYTKNGNEYRSAGGQPGPKYWQNRADYKLAVRLNDQINEISGTVIVTYTNNSPDKLPFVWMQLDQNLFKEDSRGHAIIPPGGSRSGARGQKFDGGYKIKSVKILLLEKGKTIEKNAEHFIEDTRMQVYLPNELSSGGGQLRLKIEYSFISPEYGSDRMGILNTMNGKIFSVAQWYPRMCVYDDVSGWNTIPYIGPSEFYLEYGDYDISITVPASHIVVGSGELINPQDVYTAEQQQRWKTDAQSDQTVVIRYASQGTHTDSRHNGE